MGPRLLHLPLNVPGSEQVGQRLGFGAVFPEVIEFDFLGYCGTHGNEATNRELLRIIEMDTPALGWFQLQETAIITPETIRAIKEQFPDFWLTAWSGDARDYLPPYLSQIMPSLDTYYNCTDQAIYANQTPRLAFMPIGIDFDEVTNYTHQVGNVPEVIFIGNHYGETFSNGPFRAELMHALSIEFGNKFGVYGTGWDSGTVNALGPTVLKHQSSYYHKATCVISVDHIQNILHWSERLPWALASETPVVMQHQPGIEAWFTPEEHCLMFNDIPEAIALVKRVLNEAIEPSMTTKAKALIQKKHTWRERAEQVLADYNERNSP